MYGNDGLHSMYGNDGLHSMYGNDYISHDGSDVYMYMYLANTPCIQCTLYEHHVMYTYMYNVHDCPNMYMYTYAQTYSKNNTHTPHTTQNVYNFTFRYKTYSANTHTHTHTHTRSTTHRHQKQLLKCSQSLVNRLILHFNGLRQVSAKNELPFTADVTDTMAIYIYIYIYNVHTHWPLKAYSNYPTHRRKIESTKCTCL